MGGLGQKQNGRVVRLNKECPDDIDGIVDSIRGILLTGGVQSLTVKEGEPISYERLVMPGDEILPKDSTESFAELTPFQVIRNVPMEEFSYEEHDLGTANAHERVMNAFLYLAVESWAVTHLLVSPESRFWKWLGLPLSRPGTSGKLQYFCNAKIELDASLPDDIYILCGARTRHATIAEIGCSLKCAVD